MDEIIGSLVREAGKQYAEAQKRAAAEASRRQPPPPKPPEPQRRPGITPPSVLAPPPPAPLTSMAQAPLPPRPAVPATDGLDIEPLAIPGLPGVPIVQPDTHLLAAFASPSGLLAGIVLSEALAPPVALRDSQLFGRIER